MRNAKTELLAEIGALKIKCARIIYNPSFDEENATGIILKIGYSSTDYDNFLSELDFEYDNGYGSQWLSGNVWFEDGTWLERGEYDGSEWWEHKVCPEIPEEIK